MNHTTFPKMTEVIPEGRVGVARVEHFDVDRLNSFISSLGGGRSCVPEGRYARLRVRDALVMSDTPYERRSNLEVIWKARGRVLVAGYGLGMVLCALARSVLVENVVVVEKEPDVVALVDPHVRAYLGKDASKIHVVEADIFEAKPRLKGLAPFDTLWFDIWPDACTDNLEQMARLSRTYASLKAPGAYLGHWDREYLRAERARDNRRGLW